jgi:hypothetical protein
MRGAITASEDRPRSAVELLIERLMPFEQRPAARPIVQSREIHRGGDQATGLWLASSASSSNSSSPSAPRSQRTMLVSGESRRRLHQKRRPPWRDAALPWLQSRRSGRAQVVLCPSCPNSREGGRFPACAAAANARMCIERGTGAPTRGEAEPKGPMVTPPPLCATAAVAGPWRLTAASLIAANRAL